MYSRTSAAGVRRPFLARIDPGLPNGYSAGYRTTVVYDRREKRKDAVKRAAMHCTVKNSLRADTNVDVEIGE